jgi:hypothetical protein
MGVWIDFGTRADCLYSGGLLELASSELVLISSVDRLWRTKTDGVAWKELNVDSIHGYAIDLRDSAQRGYVRPVKSDFADDDGFMLRNECEESQNVWSYKCSVYNFEVEDFHTYYVGEFGVWVHNSDCSGLFKNSVRPTSEGQELTETPNLIF